MIKKYFEFMEDRFSPISSFYLHDGLNSDIWNNDLLDENIRKELLKIAGDYFGSLEVDVPIIDIILTGSLCGYNWSKWSDFDLHIIVNVDSLLLKKYLDYSKRLWNMQHNINIRGYDVEVYCQDINEKHVSNGQYSLLDGRWIKYPDKQNFLIDEELIREKSELLMSMIDDIEEQWKGGIKWEILDVLIRNVWKKIMDNRKAGLEKEGEFSIENLVFKLLKRNGWIKKLLNMKIQIYDTRFSEYHRVSKQF